MSIRLLLTLTLCSGIASAASYPVLTYSTYLRDSFTPNAIATDPAGNIYLAGTGVIDHFANGASPRKISVEQPMTAAAKRRSPRLAG